MKITDREGVVLIALLLLGTAERSWCVMRILYLRNRSKYIKMNYQKEVTLRYAIWSHIGIFFCYVLFGCPLFPVFLEQHGFAACLFMLPVPLFFLTLSTVFFVIRLRARVIVGVGRQLYYFNGYNRHETIYSGQVDRYYCNAYSYWIKKKDGNRVKVPATLASGEFVGAFLEDAVRHNVRNR